jgi:hypothetical protein
MSFWEQSPPMGPPENPTRQVENQEPRGRKRLARRPRTRRCLLKGCEQCFRPGRARQRYCSDECRRTARKWSRWKAQQSYRATAAGKEQRNGQSRRYRERVRNRKQPAWEEAIPEAARVITNNFFRPLLRPPRLLRGIRSSAAIAQEEVLLARVPARHGTRLGA